MMLLARFYQALQEMGENRRRGPIFRKNTKLLFVAVDLVDVLRCARHVRDAAARGVDAEVPGTGLREVGVGGSEGDLIGKITEVRLLSYDAVRVWLRRAVSADNQDICMMYAHSAFDGLQPHEQLVKVVVYVHFERHNVLETVDVDPCKLLLDVRTAKSVQHGVRRHHVVFLKIVSIYAVKADMR